MFWKANDSEVVNKLLIKHERLSVSVNWNFQINSILVLNNNFAGINIVT